MNSQEQPAAPAETPAQNAPAEAPASEPQTTEGTQETPPGAEQAPPPASPLSSLWLMVALFAVIYFMMIRPARRQQKDRDAMLGAIKKNDHVLTSGGMYGIVDKIREHDVILKIDERNDVKIRVSRSSIVGVEKTAGTGDAAPATPVKDGKPA